MEMKILILRRRKKCNKIHIHDKRTVSSSKCVILNYVAKLIELIHVSCTRQMQYSFFSLRNQQNRVNFSSRNYCGNFATCQ